MPATITIQTAPGDDMPTYEYACTECGERLEVVQSFTDDALTVCPACQGKLRKVFSPVGVVFKGSGFYKTDSRAKSNASSANGSGDSSKSSDSSSDSSAAASTSDSGSSGDSSSKGSTEVKSGSSSDGNSKRSAEKDSKPRPRNSDSKGGGSKVA